MEEERAQKSDWKFGDLVWVAVHGFPKWPGQVMNPATAPTVVRKGEKDDRVLVSFFGDSSYGWFKQDVLFCFEESYTDFSKQTTPKQRLKKAFQEAVEEGKEILDRRKGLTPETMHDPVDFLDPGTGSDEEDENERTYSLKELLQVAEACPDNVGVEFGRKLGADPLGVLAMFDGNQQEHVAAALGHYWNCTKEVRGTVEEPPKGRKRGRRSRKRTSVEDAISSMDTEEFDAAKRTASQRVLREKRKISRRDSPKIFKRRTSQRLGKASIATPVYTPEPIQRSRPKEKQTATQLFFGAFEYELMDVDKDIEVKNPPCEKIGRKFTARKLKRPRKHEGRFQFELPPKFTDVVIQCKETDIIETTRLMAQDPLGAFDEKNSNENGADSALLNESGSIIEEAWTPVHVAIYRYRLSVFKRFGGRPRGSSHRRITGELTPIQVFGNAKPAKVLSKKRSTEGLPAGVGSGKYRRSKPEKKCSSYSQDIAMHPVQGEKSVHIKFPEGRELPDTSQIQYFLLTVAPNLPAERIMCDVADRKITVIFPFEDLAKEASLFFQEFGPKYFNYPEGTVLSGISTYMPSVLTVGMGTIHSSAAAGQLPDSIAHDFAVPSGLPLIDMKTNSALPGISVPHDAQPTSNIPYTESQVVQGVREYVDHCIDQGISPATWNIPQVHSVVPVPMAGPSSLQEKEICCLVSEAQPASTIGVPLPPTYYLPTDNLVYNISQPAATTVADTTLPAEQAEHDQLAIEERSRIFAADFQHHNHTNQPASS